MKYDINTVHQIFNTEPELLKIFTLLDYNARLVGGCVRDFLLINEVVYDIDIATKYSPEIVMEKLSNDFKVLTIGIKHGTLTIVGKKKYEITTLRKDVETDGRHAEVSFNNVEYKEDASRRDFTINALYMDVNEQIYDYFNGKNDLEKKLVKFINDPEKRIHEDYLRIMRFFRFVSRFGNFDTSSYMACIKLMNGLDKISLERITDEWHKIIQGKNFFDMYDFFSPLIKYLNFKNIEYDERYRKLSHNGLLALFYQEKCKIMLTNAEKKYINLINTTNINDKINATYCANKYGEVFINDLMIINDKYYEIKYYDKLPINGNDLVEKEIKHELIGKTLKKLEFIWYESDGKLSKEELLERI